MKIIIGIQGDKGSTNERACLYFANKYKWSDIEIKYLISSEKVLSALENKEIDYGTFAWGSIRGGLVTETQEAIKKHDYKKVDEITLELDHALLCNDEIKKENLVKIYSHPQALKEHKPFLEKKFQNFKLIKEIGTAIAVKKLEKKEYSENSIVIAPIGCREIYDVMVYQEDLPTNKGYETTIHLITSQS